MSGLNRSSDGLDSRRRKLLFRAWHRGMRELDLIFGRFVEAGIGEFKDAQLDHLEALLDVPDQMVLAWVTGQAEVPEAYDTDLYRAMIAFHARPQDAY